MKKNIFLFCIGILLLSLLASCGKSAPPPPRMRAELVLDLFDCLARKDHKGALAKIERLKELDKTNVFISEFEYIERTNFKIAEAEAALLKNDRVKAEKAIRDAVRVIGPLPPLVAALNNIALIGDMEVLAVRIADPVSSNALEKDIAAFKEKAEHFKSNPKLKEFARKRIDIIENLRKREDRITLNDLDADVLVYGKNRRTLQNTMESQKKIEQSISR